ncbi:RDD family protein [Methylococcus capsulatus]|uniref:RDD family protein n=1 Tax=Methylococcus capsulatus TaxID=414 RepID=UPI001C52E230|nr:RDD family protein [Methylococcus capsulatus]QXP87284.1 RDD family protein [Methylococcus capsulatus]QXP91363.1 RDD family protein [Methylococcus capsulatus]QXP92975.1 RDD family protein [Methylococcus capsulatus]UQN12283.1 RDD family protein [Methylococcus capsulatus]
MRSAAGPVDGGMPGRGEVAGVFRRFAAFLYDAFLLAGLLFAVTAAVLPLNEGQAFRSGHPAYSALLALFVFLYFGWFWTHGGQTPGMRAWRIRLCTENPGPLRGSQVAVRLLAGILTLGLGTFWAWFDVKRRTLQDIVSRVRVLRVD